MRHESPASLQGRRGVALYQAERYEAAARALRHAVTERPEDTAARRWLAAALWRAGRPGVALATLRDSVLARPDDALLWHDLGAALAAAGQWRPALFALHEYATLSPSEDRPALEQQLRARPEVSAAADRIAAAVAVLESPESGPAERTAARRALLAEPLPEHLPAVFAAAPAALGRLAEDLGVLLLGFLRRLPPAGQHEPVVVGALGRLSPELAAERLANLLGSDDPAVRAAAAKIVLRLLPDVPDLCAGLFAVALVDDEAAVQAALASSLGDVLTALATSGGPLEAMLAAIDAGPRGAVQAAADEWLAAGAWIGTPPAERVLLRIVQSDDEELAARVLGRLSGDEGAELLRRLYAEDDPLARRLALNGLADHGVWDLVSLGLWDDEVELRLLAASRLATAQDEDAAAALRDRLEHETDEQVKAAIAAALAGSAGEEAEG